MIKNLHKEIKQLKAKNIEDLENQKLEYEHSIDVNTMVRTNFDHKLQNRNMKTCYQIYTDKT